MAVHHGWALLPTATHFYDESLPKAEIHIQPAALLDGKTLDGGHYKEGGLREDGCSELPCRESWTVCSERFSSEVPFR